MQVIPVSNKDASPCGSISSAPSPFMSLPVELRLRIYSLVLPDQIISSDPTHWSPRAPEGSMNLLLCNRKVFDEARELVQRRVCGRMVSCIWNFHPRPWYEYGCWSLSKRFRGSPNFLLLANIKHWQFDLQYSNPCATLWAPRIQHYLRNLPSVDVDTLFNGEFVLEAVAQLVKIINLQSLRVKFPCFCMRGDRTMGAVPCQEYLEKIKGVLGPFRSLNFRRSVTFIAARPLGKQADDRLWSLTEDSQCQQSACLGLAAQFKELKDFIEGALPREPLSSQQRSLLDIKHAVADLDDPSDLATSLYHLWVLADSNRIVFAAPSRERQWRNGCRHLFDEHHRRLLDRVKSAVEEEKAQKAEWGSSA